MTRRWVWVALGVVALAAVVYLGGALTPDEQGSAPSTKLTPELEAQKFARDAESALSANDTDTAVTLAQRALKTDPNNVQASTILARAAAKSELTDPPAEDAGDSAPEKSQYLSEVKDLPSMLPPRISGWVAGQVVDVAPDALVTYQPAVGSSADAQAKRAVFSVHDMKSSAKAEQFLQEVAKVAYAQSTAAVAVGSVKKAHFGTDGAGTAVVAFARGRYAFETLVVAEPGVSPAGLKRMAVDLAASLPAAK
jgi:hypothetical protein